MPLFRKRKTIWQVKELEGYLNKVQSQGPPDYETSDAMHQSLDAMVREYWEYLHPVEQDFIYSWALECKTVEDLKSNLQTQIQDIDKETALILRNSEAKIEDLNTKTQNFNSDVLNLKNALIQKNQLIEDLTKAIQNQKMGGSELKEKLEKRIKDMNERAIKQQTEFEANQGEIGKKFETRVTELDEEKLLLNEACQKKQDKLNILTTQNEALRKSNQLLRRLRDKITNLKSLIAEIPSNLLEG